MTKPLPIPTISASTLDRLRMLRRAYRPVVSGNRTKRPTGGRPNPCALHREPRHPLAIAVEAQPVRKRRRALRVVPAYQRLTDAVARGEIPVGAPIGDREVRRIIKAQLWTGMEGLACQLAAARSPIRLRRHGANKWTIALA